MSILSNRNDKAWFAEGVSLHLISVGLVAAAIIVLFRVASFSLPGTSKEPLTEARINNIDSSVLVPVQAKSPSSRDAKNRPSSTPVPPPFGTAREETAGEPAFKSPFHGGTSGVAAETPHGSARGPFADETPPPDPNGSLQVTAQPLSIADEASNGQHASGAKIPMLGISDENATKYFEISKSSVRITPTSTKTAQLCTRARPHNRCRIGV